MKYKYLFIIAVALGMGLGIWACSNQRPTTGSATTTADTKKKEPEHVAYHKGCLNAMVACENGHAEVKVEGDTFKLWFVGGGQDTNRAVCIPDAKIALQIKSANGESRPLTLEARPIALAEEKVGACSYFEGKAPWLAGMTKFTATAKVSFKRKPTPLRVEYPEGYDPD